jgi:hypothetical protein
MTLKSISQHENEKRKAFLESMKTGVACPECGNELRYKNDGFFMESTFTVPPKFTVICVKKGCNWKGEIT